MAEYEPVLRTPELGPGQVRGVEAHDETLLVANVGQTYYALSARCPHDGVNLAQEGEVKGDVVVCPRDEHAYDLRTGRSPDGGPGLRRYGIRIEENVIKVGPELEMEG